MKKLLLAFLAFSSLAIGQTTETFNYTGSIVTWTVPNCVSSITITVLGASGGYSTNSTIAPGLGASMTGTFAVTPGQQLKLLVGQQPNASSGNGGGGGSFVADMSNVPWIVAGGGGGSSQATDSPLKHGQTTIAGGMGSAGGGAGGDLGNGGSIGASGFQSGAGGGFYTNGANGWTTGTGGTAFVNGGSGGATNAPANGGFGGGGSGSSYVVGGGGGGYSGGGSGGNSTAGVGGGGGSFNSGTSQNNLSGVNSGNGLITITYTIGAVPPSIVGTASVCNGATSVSYSVTNDPAITSYSWGVPSGFTIVSGQGTNTISVDAGTTPGDITLSTTDLCGLTHNDVFAITILPTSSGTDVQSACDSYQWIDGITYSSSNNTATFTLQNSLGCDSIVTLDLTILNSTSDTITQTYCDSAVVNGTTYYSSGTYLQNMQNAAGCDSTLVLNLTILQATSSTLTASSCDQYVLNGTTYISSGTYTQVLQNVAGCDSILTLDLTITNSSSSSLVETACESYTLNGTTYNSSGTYVQTISNSMGCDSTITLQLTINPPVSANASDNGDGTITGSGGTTFQWIDCASNSEIQGETTATFAPSINGNYAVVVTENGCSDTSACVLIDYLSLSQHAVKVVSLFPNPTKDFVTVQFSVPSARLIIRDALGKKVGELSVVSGQKIHLNEFEDGVYLFEFSTSEGVQTFSVVKQ